MPRTRRSISRSRGLVQAAIVVVVGLVLASGIAIWQLRLGAIASTEADNHRLGVVLAEQITRTLQAADLVLQETSEKIASGKVGDQKALHEQFGGSNINEALTKRLADLPQVVSFIIIDATGRLVNITQQKPGPEYSVADRDYFRHFASTSDPGPYISEPAISRSSGLHTIFLARRITAVDGTFLGVLIAPIRLDYFDAFFAKTGLADGTGVTILRRDGILLVRFPFVQGLTGSRTLPNAPWYKAVAAGGGHYRTNGVFSNGTALLVSAHPLTLFPVVVDVTRTEAAALTLWWNQALMIGTGVAVATLSLTLLLSALRRQIMLIEDSREQIAQQITVIQTSEARLAAQSALLETTLHHMDQGLIMVDAAGSVAICNRRAVEVLELPPNVIDIRPRFVDLIECQAREGEFTASRDKPIRTLALLSSDAPLQRRRPNGMVLEVRTAPLPDGGMVRTYTDITARAAVEEMLERAAFRDHLTDLANRNGFNNSLDTMLAAARHTVTGLAVLYLDLDRFKMVNDTLGHAAGDQLLVLVAQRMHDCTRTSDVIGRLGGDEFAIVIPNCNQDTAEHTSLRLLTSIRKPYKLTDENACIGVSIGMAIYPDDGETAEQLLRNADTALYKAKAAGRNTWCAYNSEDGHREHERILFEKDFRAAVDALHFTVAYQPICDSVTGEPVAFEALLRWNHPGRGAVSPADFIPIAEQTGLIIPLGRWVIEVACSEAAAWAMPLRIAVNLSPAQFRDHDLLSFIQDVLARTGLSPARLDLEVTEGLLLEDVDDVVKTMQALRMMGVRLVLDDFGTAHSNLSYLRGFPFDAVKIDRSFLRAVTSDQRAQALVEAILAMARALKLEVVGEGVETQEQLALLRRLGCRWVQGYLLGFPTTGEETRERIWKLATLQIGAA